MARLMGRSGINNPVGLIVDLRDHCGRQIAIALGQTEAQINSEIEKYRLKGEIPTLSAVITWDAAQKIMPLTSPTASESLDTARKLCGGGRALLIAVMANGNNYSLVQLASV